MNHFFIETKMLLSGQSAPFTGDKQNMARSRDAAFTAFCSGNGSIKLQYVSPFFPDDWVDFYEFKNMQTGYSQPVYLTTPMTSIRAVSSGNGQFWLAFTAQN